MVNKVLGKTHNRMLDWLQTQWLKDGPQVCFIEGFSGVGKTSVARSLIQSSGWPALIVNVPETKSSQADDLFLDLATELSILGYDEMAKAVEEGKPLWFALMSVLQHRVLIVLDEFQRTFSRDVGRPLGEYWTLLERIANWPNLPGRVLLLANRLVERSRWSEAYAIKTLSGLATGDAEILLDSLLEEAGRQADVPLERRRDVVNWLGCNPRAIHVLVASLENNSLDDLIGISPEIWEARDRKVSPELLYRLERELLERIIVHLEPQSALVLRKISVHRKEIKREAIELLLPTKKFFPTFRDDMITRFLMDQYNNWYSLNPIVREISLQRLKEKSKDFKRAHSKAAEYYTRHFVSKNITAGGKLAGYFVEARYHLFQADRHSDIARIASIYENYLEHAAASAYIPSSSNEKNEKIALLSAFLEEINSPTLEYYLARLYKARGEKGDRENALKYIRRATEAAAPSSYWLLRIDLEEKAYGIDEALRTCEGAVEKSLIDTSFAQIYHIYSTLLRSKNQQEGAYEIVTEGTTRVPVELGLSRLYQLAAEILVEKNEGRRALDLLYKSITIIPPRYGVATLYESAGKLLIQAGNQEDAISLLNKAISSIPANIDISNIYILLAELLVGNGRIGEAIQLLQTAIIRASDDSNLSHLYTYTAKLLVQKNKRELAIKILIEGIERVPKDKGLVHLYKLAGSILVKEKRRQDALNLLMEGISRVPYYQAYDLYISASDLLVLLKKNEEAIKIIKKGINRTHQSKGLVYLYTRGAEILVKIGRLTEALSLLNEGIKKIPLSYDGTSALYKLGGEVLLENGRYDEAILLIKSGILHVAPRNATILYRIAFKGLVMSNQHDECLKLLNESFERVPPEMHLELYRTVVDLYVRAGKKDYIVALNKESKYFTTLSDRYLRFGTRPQDFEEPEEEASGVASKEQNLNINVNNVSLDLDYVLEAQSWYMKSFPSALEIGEDQIKSIRKEVDVVIITATDIEINAVMNLLTPYPRRKSILLTYVGPETYYIGKFGAHKVVVTKCRMGSIGEGSVILATEQAQRLWKPRAIIMVGLAFGKDPLKQNIGDVIVASQIVSYEQQRVGEKVVFRGPISPTNTTLLNRFENTTGWQFVKPDGSISKRIIGPILSGEKLVDNPEYKAELFQQFPQAVGGEMEGAGLCATSGRVGVAWILVKSICDWGDGNKNSQHQPLAAAAAVSLVHHVLSQKTILRSIEKPG